MRGYSKLQHIQSMVLSMTRAGLALFYEDLRMRSYILRLHGESCFPGPNEHGIGKINTILVYEIGGSQTFLSRGMGVFSIIQAWQNVDFRHVDALKKMCFNRDEHTLPNAYFGKNLLPFDMIFHKTNAGGVQHTDMDMLDLYTFWFNKRQLLG